MKEYGNGHGKCACVYFVRREKMWIRQIVIHGFKSYAERTEIGEFDQQFNAITGLNGSGKSNILDSICFVLGISNLSQVFENIDANTY